MRWRRLPKGEGQIDDRRGRSGGSGGFGRGGMPIPMGKAGGGMGIVALILVLVVSCMGGGNFLGGGDTGFDGLGLEPLPQAPGPSANEPIDVAPDVARDFVAAVSADIQRTWTRLFRAGGEQYRATQIVLFTRSTRGGCGPASAATGPFYCTLDHKIYIDLGFFNQLANRFGAPGDFAQAYVIAHEYGHHVQNLLGINRRVQEVARSNPNAMRGPEGLAVRMELQADCFAGVWAHSAYRQDLLEPGDIEEGLAAAEAVGDDRIQATTTGRVNPESWTHGSAAQRQEWFTRGLESGDPNSCDTFSGGV